MISRRALLVAASAALLPMPLRALAWPQKTSRDVFAGEAVYNSIMRKATDGHWAKLPISERMGRIATELLGTPYVGHTLELDDTVEYCVINLDGLDCVTFFESTLNFARILRAKNPSKEAFLRAVQHTRYRGGKLGDYTSRLHYTTDWFYDNVRKGVVRDISGSLPGAQSFTQKVGYMSAHPEAYRQLKAHPEYVPTFKNIEDEINGRKSFFVPIDKIADAERFLQTGDIIGICTTQPGIDIAHTGICFKDTQGVVHFMDASSAASRMKVTLESRLSEAIRWSRRNTGIIVARPLEVR